MQMVSTSRPLSGPNTRHREWFRVELSLVRYADKASHHACTGSGTLEHHLLFLVALHVRRRLHRLQQCLSCKIDKASPLVEIPSPPPCTDGRVHSTYGLSFKLPFNGHSTNLSVWLYLRHSFSTSRLRTRASPHSPDCPEAAPVYPYQPRKRC